MCYIMKDKQRKKAQRGLNKRVRHFNKALLNDNLWRGRFVIRQIDAHWYRFDDNSGGILAAIMEVRDLKTGKFSRFNIDNYNSHWHLFEPVNKFIAEYSGVWDNIQEVKDDKTDWTKITWVPNQEITMF